jgi:hypothetical protein
MERKGRRYSKFTQNKIVIEVQAYGQYIVRNFVFRGFGGLIE